MARQKRLTEAELARIHYLHEIEKLTGAIIAARMGFSRAKVYRILGQRRRTTACERPKAA